MSKMMKVFKERHFLCTNNIPEKLYARLRLGNPVTYMYYVVTMAAYFLRPLRTPLVPVRPSSVVRPQQKITQPLVILFQTLS